VAGVTSGGAFRRLLKQRWAAALELRMLRWGEIARRTGLLEILSRDEEGVLPGKRR